ncbi:vesicle transport protein USE1-like [Sinocyclocheilus anshuiensis]|uniref:vesicle transport protein USE1-like n=1 Tax=Sinocyclocheilus anshuiensis TaxID=1608454 RepID=UPI0007BA4377|nr:PREDICTED: vesicle transport protein USE1-like [Sinocyclocheilus anshuiensis]
MATSRLEINFIRLLSRCESLASEKRNETEWRLEKYVGALEEMLVALKKSPSKPTPEVLTDYNRKVDFLKGLLEADKLPSPAEKSLANQFLAPGRTPTISSERTPASKTVHIQSKARSAWRYKSTLTQSMRQADMNFEKLKTESERLEQHAKKSVNWFLWLMLIVVSFTFISMILFIRLFPRLR